LSGFRRAIGVAAFALACSRCARRGGDAAELPPGYTVAERMDVNGDGREDALLQAAGDRGALGCSHVLWASGPGGYRFVSFLREQVFESQEGVDVMCFRFAAAREVTRGWRDLTCLTRVDDQETFGLVRAVVRYRWDGTRYVSELAHLVKGTAPHCEVAQARTDVPVRVLPARNVAVVQDGDGRSGQGTQQPTATRGELRRGERFEPVRDVVDAEGLRWTGVPGKGWVESTQIECTSE